MRVMGRGGQHRNVTDSCVVAKHIPTGLTVRIDSRSQHQNKKVALRILAERLSEKERRENLVQRSKLRKDQVGSGMRGCKIRTYYSARDKVVDHQLCKHMSLKRFMKGYIDDLWK